VLGRISELGAVLRQNGLRVSIAEIQDAGRAAAAVGLEDPMRLRAALAATLVKRRADLPLFEELFDLTFMAGRDLLRLAPLADLLRRAGIGDERAADMLDKSRGDVASLSPLTRMALGVGATGLPSLLQGASETIDLGRMMSPLQIGFFTQRVLDALDLAAVQRQLDMLWARLADLGLGPDERQQLGQLVDQAIERIRDSVREFVRRELQRRRTTDLADARLQALADRPLVSLSEAEVVELRGEVARLARSLRARIALEPKRPRRGRLDLRRTLRRSLATGGVPIDLRLTLRRPRRPRVVVLCDISDSVRQVSRFLLELVYALAAEFDKVSSFAFVAELGELTELFRNNRVDRALELAYGGAVVNVFANSNYGRVLASFADRHLGLVSRRTTVLVIGDGRNNYHPARADCLATIRRHARQVLWLNPEPPAVWGFGDSAMAEYAPHCDGVLVARDLRSLREVVDQLVMGRSHRRVHGDA